MIISKFNTLLHNKVFLWIIAGLVCITMAALYMPGKNSSNATRKAQAVGKLYGKAVLMDEYRQAFNDTYLTTWLSYGGRFTLNDTTRPYIEKAAWARLAMLKKAEKLGLSTSNEEMLQTVRSLPVFLNQQGQFDPQAYKYGIAAIQNQLGYTARQLEEAYRSEATLQKVVYLPMQSTLVTPDEIKDAFHNLNDTFVVKYAELNEELVKNSVTVSDEEVQTFYNENSSRFATQEKVRVKYAQFPVANYLDQVSVSDIEAQAYYDQNLEQYIFKAATTNTPAEYTAFDDVKASVVEKVKLVGARRKAMEAATKMVIDLTPARDGGKTATFEEAATTMNATVKFAPDFAATDTPENIDAAAEFARVAFTLEDTPRNYYSDAIVGENYVYVIGLVRNLPSIIPEFEVVKAEAKALALNYAVRKAFYEKATLLQETAGANFETVLAATGTPVKTTPEFSISNGLEDNPNGRMLTHIALSIKQGEVSAPLATENNTLILAQLTERNAADEADIAVLRDTLIAAVENQHLETIMQNWQDNILVEAEFVDLMTTAE